MSPGADSAPERQSGERALVLARLRTGTSAPPPANHAHPAPAPDSLAPELHFHLLDGDDPLATVFARTADEAGATVHPGDPAAALAEIVERHHIHTAVATGEPAVAAVVALLDALGVEVAAATDRDAAVAADIGVTSCLAAVAATGSVAISAAVPGARWASLLPRVHLCVVPEAVLIGAPGDLLRRFTPDAPPPRGLWFVTGPSRTGDIEQLLTRGVHGPVAVEVLLLPAPG